MVAFNVRCGKVGEVEEIGEDSGQRLLRIAGSTLLLGA